MNSFSLIPSWSGLCHLEEKKKTHLHAVLLSKCVTVCIPLLSERRVALTPQDLPFCLSDCSFNPGAKLPSLVTFKMILVCAHKLEFGRTAPGTAGLNKSVVAIGFTHDFLPSLCRCPARVALTPGIPNPN